jgi:hypothetical protein
VQCFYGARRGMTCDSALASELDSNSESHAGAPIATAAPAYRPPEHRC